MTKIHNFKIMDEYSSEIRRWKATCNCLDFLGLSPSSFSEWAFCKNILNVQSCRVKHWGVSYFIRLYTGPRVRARSDTGKVAHVGGEERECACVCKLQGRGCAVICTLQGWGCAHTRAGVTAHASPHIPTYQAGSNQDNHNYDKLKSTTVKSQTADFLWK